MSDTTTCTQLIKKGVKESEEVWIKHSTEDTPEYIYKFVNIWDNKLPLINFICLNPREFERYQEKDPRYIPTIRNILDAAKKVSSEIEKEFGGLVIANLFAKGTKNSRHLRSDKLEVEKINNDVLKRVAKSSDIIILAWGNEENIEKAKKINGRAKIMLKNLCKYQGKFHQLVIKGEEDYLLTHPKKFTKKDIKNMELKKFNIEKWQKIKGIE